MAQIIPTTPDEMKERVARRRQLVQANIKSIAGQFEDPTDFETVADLQAALHASQKEVDSINPLLEQLSRRP